MEDHVECEPESPPSSHDTPQAKKASAVYSLLVSARMAVTFWAYFIVSLVVSSFDSVLPLFVKETFGWGKTAQGLIFIPLCVPHVFDPLVGHINDAFPNSRRYTAAGALVASVPPLVALRFVTEDSISHKILLCGMLALVGACIATIFPPLLAEASYVVHEKEKQTPGVFGKGGAMALSYGLLNIAFAAGTVVGPLFAGFIRERGGWKTMTWAMALLTGGSGLPVLLFLGGFLFHKGGDELA